MKNSEIKFSTSFVQPKSAVKMICRNSTMLFLFNFLVAVYIFTNAASAIKIKKDGLELSTHPCFRTCEDNGTPMTCYYKFKVMHHSSMGLACYDCPRNISDCYDPECVPTDGIEKALIVVNKRMPGPLIEACKGDRIIVDVKNDLSAESTTVHWHGVHQKGTPFMDGVPYVTQCPILPGKTFRYNFTVNDYGTFLWHSHTFEQRADGMFGGVIVREPIREDLYDVDEHVIFLNEWTDLSATDSYAREMYGNAFPEPYNILINGLGRPQNSSMKTPVAIFEVEQGKRYRFRIINSGSQDCPMMISFENHTMLAFNSDGRDFEPVRVKSIRTLSGERFDIVIDANQTIGNYWIKVKGVDAESCEHKKILQRSILRYKGAPEVEPSTVITFGHPSLLEQENLLNPLNQGQDNPLCIASLKSSKPDNTINVPVPDHQFYISYDTVGVNAQKYVNNTIRRERYYDLPGGNPKTSWQLNNINFDTPAVPLLTQPEMVDPNVFCNATTLDDCYSKYCKCTHLLEAKLNSIVEVIIVDSGDININHPMHLHGYYFRVVAIGRVENATATVDLVKQLDKEGKIKRNLETAPYKDTILVPSNGYTIFRFYADNPGYWLFHCHYERHAHIGMEVLFKVGEEKDFPEIPKDFPRC